MDELQQRILRVYRLAQEAATCDFQTLALEQVRGVFSFDACRWGNALTYTTHCLKFDQVYLENEDPDIMGAYAEVAELDQMGLIAAANPGRAFNFNARSQYGGLASHASFLDYLCRFQHENMLIIGVVSPSKTAKSLSFYRADTDDFFTERERHACELIFPHLLEALSINLKLNLSRFKDSQESGRWPMAMYASNGVLLYAEAEFSALIAEQWPRTAQTRLPDAVINAFFVRRQQRCLVDQVLICLSQRIGDVLYLKARPRQAVDELTARELQIARLVARGMSFKEIAAAIDLAPATVRNYIQRIHERLEIRSNAELGSKLAQALP